MTQVRAAEIGQEVQANYFEETAGGGGLAAHLRRNRIAYVGGALMLAIAIGIRIYQQMMAFSVGMDFYEPEFHAYWMPLLYGEIVVLGGIMVLGSIYMWMTRVRDASSVTPEVELKRYFTLLGVFTVLGVWAALIAALAIESDAAWHQVAIRDTDFTPTHIVIFYFSLPLLTAILIPTFIWAHTRIPAFMNRVSIPFLGVVCGIFMIMPNYGFNEWGHTFFYAEELFAAPIHWGFVVLGWSLFFLGPLAVQLIQRMTQLIAVVTTGKDCAMTIPSHDQR
jgi:methane/ammonia monooxygenase subunit C